MPGQPGFPSLLSYKLRDATQSRCPATLPNDIGVEISKRQVIRFLTERLDEFHADVAVLHAGLVSALFVTVNDTGARHANRNFHTTQIRVEHFTAFRTAPSKSRLSFLALLRDNYHDDVLNDAAFTYMEDRQADPGLLARPKPTEPQHFTSRASFLNFLAAKGIDIFIRCGMSKPWVILSGASTRR